MIYALDADRRTSSSSARWRRSRELEGVDLIMTLADGEAVVRGRRGELRFTPGGELSDLRGERWSVEGDLRRAAGRAPGRPFPVSTEYPDALTRIWSALHCPNAGEILLSAAPGYEFVDWGGSDHVGGGSHGSLHRSDSLGRPVVVRDRTRTPGSERAVVAARHRPR